MPPRPGKEGQANGPSGAGPRSGLGSACGVHRLVQLIDQRMPHIRHRHAMLAIELLLEGKDHQHVIDDPGDLLYPAAAPRPDLRGNVIEDAHAELMAPAGHTQVELRIVDEDDGIRAVSLDSCDQLDEYPPEEAKVTQHVEA